MKTPYQELIEAADPFKRVIAIAHPSSLTNDERGLRDILPGIWPTVGDLKRLSAAISRASAHEEEIRKLLARPIMEYRMHEDCEANHAVDVILKSDFNSWLAPLKEVLDEIS